MNISPPSSEPNNPSKIKSLKAGVVCLTFNELYGVISQMIDSFLYSRSIILIIIGGDSIDWIDLAQDRNQWRALVNTVMNLQVP
jgi:hypothetical protein